jgi:hypothetical protein
VPSWTSIVLQIPLYVLFWLQLAKRDCFRDRIYLPFLCPLLSLPQDRALTASDRSTNPEICCKTIFPDGVRWRRPSLPRFKAFRNQRGLDPNALPLPIASNSSTLRGFPIFEPRLSDAEIRAYCHVFQCAEQKMLLYRNQDNLGVGKVKRDPPKSNALFCVFLHSSPLSFLVHFCSLAIKQLPFFACCLTETSSSSSSPTSDAAASAMYELQAANALASGELSSESSQPFTAPKEERRNREDHVAIVSGAIRRRNLFSLIRSLCISAFSCSF